MGQDRPEGGMREGGLGGADKRGHTPPRGIGLRGGVGPSGAWTPAEVWTGRPILSQWAVCRSRPGPKCSLWYTVVPAPSQTAAPPLPPPHGPPALAVRASLASGVVRCTNFQKKIKKTSQKISALLWPSALPPENGTVHTHHARAVLNGKRKKKVFRYTVFPKKPAGTACAQPWLVAVGGWRLAAVGGWQLATGGWWRLVVVGGGWWLVIGGW